MMPLEDFKYNELLLTATGSKGGIYAHAGAFVRRVIPSKNKDKKKVEVYYYDSNQNTSFSFGGQSLGSVPMNWNIFREYELVKMFALTSRELEADT